MACYAAIGLGTMFGGWRIVKTMGQKITSSSRGRLLCRDRWRA